MSTSLPPPSQSDHGMGLLALANSDVWDTIRAVSSAVKQQQGGAEQGGVVEDAPLEVGGGWSVGSSKSGVPIAMAMRFATRQDIDAALIDQEPPFQRPDMPLRPVDELVVPKNYTEMLRNEHAALYLDAMQREVFGLLSAKTFKPVEV